MVFECFSLFFSSLLICIFLSSLLKNLRKMKSKQERASAKASDSKAAVRAEVESLVQDTNPGKTAAELLSAYEGREEELVAHLKKLKSSKRDVV